MLTKVNCKKSITDTVDIGPWFLSPFLCHKTDNVGALELPTLSHRHIGNYHYSIPFSNELISLKSNRLLKMSQGIFYEMALAKVSAISSLCKEKVAIPLRRAVNRNLC